MEIKVMFFGVLKQVIGAKEKTFQFEKDTIMLRDLVLVLTQQYPSLEPRLTTIAYAINNEFAEIGQSLQAGDQVALLPPVSGG